MSIAAFIDVPGANQDLAIELAIAMAEFSIAENQPLYLLADAVTTLEVGMSLIGSRESRTIEGGEYRPSPLVLLPFIPRPDSPEDEVLRSSSESDVGGEIDEFYALGLFARRGEGPEEWDFSDQTEVAFSEVIARVKPQHIVGLGSTSIFWTSVSTGMERL